MTLLNNAFPKQIIIMPMTDHTYPELYADVYVCGGDNGFNRMLALAKCKLMDDPMKADLVIFTGGVDISPDLYGHKRHHKTGGPDLQRDNREKLLFELCVEHGIPMVGICRGSQFLHAMNGGTLYQHVEGHLGAHPMIDVRNDQQIRVSSTHHQMMKFNSEMEVIGVALKGVAWKREECDSRNVITIEHERSMNLPQVEACYYRETNTLCVQGHPEYQSYEEFTVWFLNLLNETTLLSVAEGGVVYWPQDQDNPRRMKATYFKPEKEAK